MLKELLESDTISKAVADALDGEIQTELTSLRNEAKSYREKYDELNTTFNEVSESKKSLEAQVTSLDEKIKQAKEDGKKELVDELEKERNEKNELVDKFNKVEATNKKLKIENSLSKSLSGFDLIDAEIVSEVLSVKLELKDDAVIFNDGKSLEDGLKNFFDSKPHLLKAKGNVGSGADGDGSGVTAKAFKDMSIDERSELHRTNKELYDKLKKDS